MKPLIFIRTEANAEVALGHLRRCLAVAQAASALGAQVMVMADDEEPVRAMTRSAGAGFLPAQARIGSPQDAQAVRAAASGARALLLDSYRMDQAYMEALRGGPAVSLIDDNADRSVACDVLINFNAAAAKLRYQGKIGRTLFGPAFVPLAADYLSGACAPSAEVSTLMVTMGGIDHYGLSQRALAALQSWPSRLKILIVIGPYYENLAAIKQAAKVSLHEVELVHQPDGLASVIRRSDLGLCAGGQTLYELGALGRPALGMALWPNQRLNVKALAQAGAVMSLQYSEGAAFDESLEKSLLRLLRDADLRASLSAKGKALIDGQGARRIAMEMLKG